MPRNKKLEVLLPNVIKNDDTPFFFFSDLPSRAWMKVFIELTTIPDPQKASKFQIFTHRYQRLALTEAINQRWGGGRINIQYPKGGKTAIKKEGAVIYRLLRLIEEVDKNYEIRDEYPFYSEFSLNPKSGILLPKYNSIPMHPSIIFLFILKEYQWGSLGKTKEEITKTAFLAKFRKANKLLKQYENPFTSPTTKMIIEAAIEICISNKYGLYGQDFKNNYYTPFLDSRQKLATHLSTNGIQTIQEVKPGKTRISRQGRKKV